MDDAVSITNTPSGSTALLWATCPLRHTPLLTAVLRVLDYGTEDSLPHSSPLHIYPAFLHTNVHPVNRFFPVVWHNLTMYNTKETYLCPIVLQNNGSLSITKCISKKKKIKYPHFILIRLYIAFQFVLFEFSIYNLVKNIFFIFKNLQQNMSIIGNLENTEN